MSRGSWLYAGRQGVEEGHGLVVPDGVILYHLHGLEFLQPGFAGDLVFSRIRVVFQVSHICYVADIPDFITQLFQKSNKYIINHTRTGMSQVGVAVYSGAADIKTHMSGNKWLKFFLFPGKGIVYE
jgi:hypothetical protein